VAVHLAFSFAMMCAELCQLVMKYPLHTQSQPVSGEAAKKLLEAIDSGSTVVNDRVLALAKRIAARRRKAQNNG
jgi:hypothetical protein